MSVVTVIFEGSCYLITDIGILQAQLAEHLEQCGDLTFLYKSVMQLGP